MGEIANYPSPDTVILLFGAQTPNITDQAASHIRSKLASSPQCQWIKEALTGLEDEWNLVKEEISELNKLSDKTEPTELGKWLQSGVFSPAAVPLPNYLLTPIVVAIQLSQYLIYHEGEGDQDNQYQDPVTKVTRKNTETLGFCTGLLSAVAIACSKDAEDLKRFGSTAIRLAMLIGALADSDLSSVESSRSGWASVSVSWGTPESKLELTRILESFPQAYISVAFDEKRVTVTHPQEIATSLLPQLYEAGLTTAAIGLQGRFHAQKYYPGIERIIEFCDSHRQFQLPDASALVMKTRSNLDGSYIRDGKLHHVIIRAMLEQPANWYQTFAAMQSGLTTSGCTARILSFGLDRCVPPTLARRLEERVIQVMDSKAWQALSRHPAPDSSLEPGALETPYHWGDQIAVVGMAVQVAGANDLDDYWSLLCNGVSQHQEVPGDRFGFDTAWRTNDPKRKWFGNFIEDVESFDHKFWRKTPRESSSMDPQQRLMMQVALQAVQQSGYFGSRIHEKRVGCFIGLGTVDYEENIACHPPTAFAATGNLRAFCAGRISHSLGWIGPAVTLDTACSASAVAVHQACKAILGGECLSAVAGGVSIMTSARQFQDLAAASFLSTTGPCKPFDAKADGYCRGDGVGAVFLKKMSTAIEDGDQILGVIPSSAVYQNQNFTAITVPNTESLSELFSDVTKAAKLEPRQITVVEAHGTGTQVGDPAEYGAIRNVFGGSIRRDTLSVGSVKGLIGHTEGAAGIISLVKVLLMMREGSIPPQASHSTINPSLNALATDNMEVNMRLKPWKSNFKAALINSYGASGSNASMIVTQAPALKEKIHAAGVHHPFWISGFDDRAIHAYASKFRKFLKKRSTNNKKISLANLSFNNSRQTNRWLHRAWTFTCESIEELEGMLEKAEVDNNSFTTRPAAAPPVILCFGGQVSTYVGLDRQTYESSKLLRKHLHEVNSLSKELGGPEIFPAIFQKDPIEDTLELQMCLFASQYACAKTWIDCGLDIASVVGHSFGELTAMCVSGTLSLEDAVEMIQGRARLIRDSWGVDKGAMIAVQGDLEDVMTLLAKANAGIPEEASATIACFNGPQSFTLAGPTTSINEIERVLSDDTRFSGIIKSKRLSVTHAFHSRLAEPLRSRLEDLGKRLTIRKPTIRLERAVESATSNPLTPDFLGAHLRNPVYFGHAVQRLAAKYPSGIWLEAGSNSSITAMAKKAVELNSKALFQPVDITSRRGLSNLAEIASALWKAGLTVSFWPHHKSQTHEYDSILLPPYQFEATRHWLELKKPVVHTIEPAVQYEAENGPIGLWNFVEYLDRDKRCARFRINTTSGEFSERISDYKITGGTSFFPITFQLEIVVAALTSITPEFDESCCVSQIQDVGIHSPIPVDASLIWLDIKATDSRSRVWSWTIGGTPPQTTGKVVLRARDDFALHAEFARHERLIRHQRCLNLLNSKDTDDVIQGRNIYKSYAEVIDCGPRFRGLQKIVGRDDESAGVVAVSPQSNKWFDAGLADVICQVASIFANSMTERPDSEIFIPGGIEHWFRSPRPGQGNGSIKSLHVFATHHWEHEVKMISDLFVFEPQSGTLLEVILGVEYLRGGLTLHKSPIQEAVAPPNPAEFSNRTVSPSAVATTQTDTTAMTPEATMASVVSTGNIAKRVIDVLASISGLAAEEIKNDTGLADIGIDSLMGMELARDIDQEFECSLNPDDLNEVIDVQSLVECVVATLGGSPEGVDKANSDEPVSGSSRPATMEFESAADTVVSRGNDTNLPRSVAYSAFAESKALTDKFIVENKLAGYADRVIPAQTNLTVAHIVDALERFGSNIRTAEAGMRVELFQQPPVIPTHRQYIDQLHFILENDAKIVKRQVGGEHDDICFVRTDVPLPSEKPDLLHQSLVSDFPEHVYDHNLTQITGSKLADILTGDCDGIQLLFASKEGRENISGMYGRSPINTAWLKQLEDFFGRLIRKLKLDASSAPLNILEMGAGTGGTSAGMIAMLTALNVPVRYTITDISPSLVASARKRFRDCPFVDFRVCDIEKQPGPDLMGTQHIVFATNCVHATRNLAASTSNIREMLRDDGFLIMLEMTSLIPWIDLSFGMLEGWWLFDDGRKHALAHQELWEETMLRVKYDYVDWTDGSLPEASLQRLIIAMARRT